MQFGTYATTNTKLAAALLTLGVKFKEIDTGRGKIAPVSNVYSEEKPYKAGVPGTVTYYLETESEAFGLPAELLGMAWESADYAAATDLDHLVAEVAEANAELGQRLRKLLPMALACYLRAGYENRERILDLWRKAKPMVLVRRNGLPVLVPVHGGEEQKRRWLGGE